MPREIKILSRLSIRVMLGILGFVQPVIRIVWRVTNGIFRPSTFRPKDFRIRRQPIRRPEPDRQPHQTSGNGQSIDELVVSSGNEPAKGER